MLLVGGVIPDLLQREAGAMVGSKLDIFVLGGETLDTHVLSHTVGDGLTLIFFFFHDRFLPAGSTPGDFHPASS